MSRGRCNFKLTVRMLSSTDDFDNNNHLLDSVKGHQYESVIMLLKLGADIKSSIESLNHIESLSRETSLSQSDVIRSIGGFMKLSYAMDLNNASDSLLTRYMHHVIDCESISFVSKIGNTKQSFTDKEVEKLKSIDKEYDL